jgi:immunity protein 8 of polymorphic toxin system
MSTRAHVRAIYTSGMDDLAKYTPEDPSRFCLSIRAMVGPENEKGEESFDINVCTPAWLEQECRKQGFVVGRHYLFVLGYDRDVIKATLRRIIENCKGSSWPEVASKVARIGYWEFEDYKGSK